MTEEHEDEYMGKWLEVTKYIKDPNLPDCVIFDIDGTLAFGNGRSPYDYSKVETDLPNEPAMNALYGFANAGKKIFYLTGRDAVCKPQTINWLKRYCPWTWLSALPNELPELLMRPEGDKRRDSTVKSELYEQYIKGKYNVLAVFEDRKRVINECWIPKGIFVFDCSQGVDF